MSGCGGRPPGGDKTGEIARYLLQLTWCRDNLNIHLAPELADFAAADVDGLVRIVKRKLKKIQYRPHLIDGCLGATGLTIEPW